MASRMSARGEERRRREFERLTAQEREKLIAVHEAGHAVAHFYHQSLFQRMSLGDEGGLVNVGPAAFVADALFDALRGDPDAIAAQRCRNDYKTAAAVDTLVAGSIAEFRWMKWRPLLISPGDESRIDRVLRHVHGERFATIAPGAKRAGARRVQALFRRRGVWQAALDLADQLIRRREMEGVEVFNFFRERGVPSTGLRDYMKSSRAAARGGTEPPPAGAR
jgi:hypothetical protein